AAVSPAGTAGSTCGDCPKYLAEPYFRGYHRRRCSVPIVPPDTLLVPDTFSFPLSPSSGSYLPRVNRPAPNSRCSLQPDSTGMDRYFCTTTYSILMLTDSIG